MHVRNHLRAKPITHVGHAKLAYLNPHTSLAKGHNSETTCRFYQLVHLKPLAGLAKPSRLKPCTHGPCQAYTSEELWPQPSLRLRPNSCPRPRVSIQKQESVVKAALSESRHGKTARVSKPAHTKSVSCRLAFAQGPRQVQIKRVPKACI